MAAGHNSIRRIVHRAGEELHSTKEIASQTSWHEALETFHAKWDIQVMNHNGFAEPPAVRNRLIHKHEIMLKYFEQRYGDFYRNYDYSAPMTPMDPDMEGRIWICWWQGLENAPEIVKRCVESIRRNAGDHQVTIITDQNVEQYIDIPEWVKRNSPRELSLELIFPICSVCLCWLDMAACGLMPRFSARGRFQKWHSIILCSRLNVLIICIVRLLKDISPVTL